MTTPSLDAAAPAAADPLFPSSYFAKVPAEALSPLAHAGATAMTHAEFRVFVALCRFRGAARVVNPKRETLLRLTGMTPNNISRATAGLQAKGWLTIHYLDGKKSRVVENYELRLPAADAAVNRPDKGTQKAPGATRKGRARVTPQRPTTAQPGDATADLAPEVYSLSDAELDELLAEQLALEA